MSSVTASGSSWYPGQVWTAQEEVEGLSDRETRSIMVTNTGDRPVQVGSHFHFFEVNKALDFDRKEAYGMRLMIPAGTAVRFEPGMIRKIEVVALSGKREVYGFNGKVNGLLPK